MKQSRLIPFLEDLFTDVKESGKTSIEYFDTKAENKEQFMGTDLYKKYLEPISDGEKIADALFKQMEEDALNEVTHLYLPNQNGDFSRHQRSIFYRLVDALMEKAGVELEPLPSAKTIKKETSKRLLDAGNLTIVTPLKLNEETRLIEGEVINSNDPEKQVLKVTIDPNRPEEISFENSAEGNTFAVENSDSGLGIFIGTKTGDIAVLIGAAVKITRNTPLETGSPIADKSDEQVPEPIDPEMVLAGLIPETGDQENKEELNIPEKDQGESQIEKTLLIPQEPEAQSKNTTTQSTQTKQTRRTRRQLPYKQAGERAGSLRMPYIEKMNVAQKTKADAEKPGKDSEQRQVGRFTEDRLKQEEDNRRKKQSGVEEGSKKTTPPQKKKGSSLMKGLIPALTGVSVLGGGVTIFTIIM
jgi:hypothetical protein